MGARGGGLHLLFVQMNNDYFRLGLFLLVSLEEKNGLKHGRRRQMVLVLRNVDTSPVKPSSRWMTQFSQSVKMSLSSSVHKENDRDLYGLICLIFSS